MNEIPGGAPIPEQPKRRKPLPPVVRRILKFALVLAILAALYAAAAGVTRGSTTMTLPPRF